MGRPALAHDVYAGMPRWHGAWAMAGSHSRAAPLIKKVVPSAMAGHRVGYFRTAPPGGVVFVILPCGSGVGYAMFPVSGVPRPRVTVVLRSPWGSGVG